MTAPRGKNWKLLGSVGVDSGQLMVCDPTYIDSEWNPGQAPSGHPAEVLTEKGKQRFPDNKDWSWRYNGYGTTYASPQEVLGGMSVNEARDEGLIVASDNPTSQEFSYRGCCDASRSDKGGGSMDFKAGHEGAGVAFSSGYGDGCYEVWGKTNEEDRVIEVRILMGSGKEIFDKLTGRS